MQVQSKIEKVPRGIRGEKSSKDMASSRNWSQQLKISKSQNGGRNQVSGRVSVPCRHATPVADALWKPVFSNNVKVGKKSSQGKP